MHIRLFFAFLLACTTFSFCYAQPYVIKGTVTDTVNNFPLENASVTLIRTKDSVLGAFTRAKADGSFSLDVKEKGTFIFSIAFPGFADYVDKIEVSNNELNLGQIPLVSKTHLLKEFVYTEQFAAIKVKGDTIEYVADSFKTDGGANVEALLKKLPGLQVDKDGKISAQGTTVQKLLVDGEEFFSDDPAVVSKSLQADAVDKVQVFDKKSEQAEFTGIDDGEKTRTINLQLKEDRKKGYFGKLSAAGGAGNEQNYFENQGMFNAFKGKRKISAFGIVANTGKIGLGWEDRDKFGGGGGNAEISEDGWMYTSWDESMEYFGGWSGRYNGEGLPKAWTGGAHYSNKWNEDKHHFSSNYRYGKQDIETIHNILTENFLPGDAKYFTQQENSDFNASDRHRIDGLYEWKPDTTSILKLSANANYAHSQKRSNYFTESFTENEGGKERLNDSRRTLTNDATTMSINSTLSWRKKMKKKGRSIALNFNERYSETDADGFLFSYNNYYNNGKANDTVNQKKENNNSSFSLSNNITYTEPLSKVFFLEFNYGLKADNNDASKLTYNKTNPYSDAYDSIDRRFSSNYAYDILTHSGGTSLKYSAEKLIFSVGGNISNARFIQKDLFVDTSARYWFTNLFPSANFTYKMSKQRSLRLNYRGSTKQPTIQQIQPLQDNTDPLNIAIGNPNITQEFNNNISATFNDYKVLSARYIWMNVNFNFIDNAISRAENIDATGRKTYQYVNVDGNYSANGWFGGGKTFTKINTRIGMSANFSLSHINNIINGVRNTSDYNSYGFGPDFSYDSEDEKFSVWLDTRATYNDNRAQVNTQVTSYWTSNNEFGITYKLPWKFTVNSEVEWYIRQQTSIFDRNNNVFKWNAYVSKKFLKNDVLELRASVFDILNQNLGFNRFAQNNYITEDNYNTIRRYGLLGLTWNFTKSPLGAPGGTE